MAEMLEEVAAGKARPVVLIEGDEYLARTSARELADAIVPEKDRALNLVILGAAAGAREIASHLVTVRCSRPPKAVLWKARTAFAERWMRRGSSRERATSAGKAAARRRAPAAQAGAAGGLGSGGGGVRLETGAFGGEVAQGDRAMRRRRLTRVAAGLSAWALAQNVAAPPTIWRCW